MNVQQFPDVFFTLIRIESFLGCESLSDFGKFVLDSFSLRLFVFALSDIRDEFVEASHVGGPTDNVAKHHYFLEI